MVREMRKFQGRFISITDLKVQIIDEFKDQVPQSTAFSVGYFKGRHSTKYWICTEQDLNAMYNHCHNEIMLWCDGHITDESTAKCPRSEGACTKREEKSDGG